MSLAQRTVIIVGGGSGIGLGVARACLSRGANVVLAGRNLAKLEGALAALQAGEQGRAVATDITDEARVVELFREVAEFDHVVVTAADLAYEPITSFDLGAAQRALASKLLGALLVAKHAAPRLPRTGSITFTTGVASERPRPGGSLTATVNGGLHSFVRAAAIELAPVRVNALSPGWVDSGLWDHIPVDKAAAFAKMSASLPTGRIATPADLGHAALFLMESEMTTGAVLTVDGGQRFV